MSPVDTARRAVRRADMTITGCLWAIVAGVIVYSLMTTTPLVAAHSAWPWSAWLLGLMVDAAFVLALQAEAVLSRYGARAGLWPAVLRWGAGTASLGLNVGHAWTAGDRVGVAIHAVAPALLLAVGEAAPVYRRAMANVVTELEKATATAAAEASAQVDVVVRSTARPVDTTAAQPDAHERALDSAADTVAPARLSAEDATVAIRDAYARGLSVREAARLSTRSASYVGQVYRRLADEMPMPGQLTLTNAA